MAVQVCVIEFIAEKEKQVYGILEQTGSMRWEAQLYTPQGPKVFKSIRYKSVFQKPDSDTTLHGMLEKFNESADQNTEIYLRLITELMIDGWKPFAKDNYGQIVTMKRDA